MRARNCEGRVEYIRYGTISDRYSLNAMVECSIEEIPPIPWHFQALLSFSPNAQLAPLGIPASYPACPFGPFWIAYSRDLA